MATLAEDVDAKTAQMELEPKTNVALKAQSNSDATPKGEDAVAVEIEPITKVPFPVKLDDGKLLNGVGLMKKNMFGMDIKIYAFGIYTHTEKIKDLLKSKFEKAPEKPTTEEMFKVIIDSDVEVTIKMVFVFAGLAMGMLKTNFTESLSGSMAKLTTDDGQNNNDELAKKVLAEASDFTVLMSGSVIEISRLPGYILQTKVLGKEVSKVESELLCRGGVNMFLGDEPTDKDTKEKIGMALLSFF